MIIDIILPLSLVFIMFTLGMGLTFNDFKYVVSDFKTFLIGLINQMVILPIVAFIICNLFNLNAELAVGIMILSCCPGGITSNMLTKLAKGDIALSISYTAVISIVTAFTLPLITRASMQYFLSSDTPHINTLSLGFTMFLITAIPVILGLLLNTRFYNLSKKLHPIANKTSNALFIFIVFGALVSEWNTFITNLYSLGPSIISLILTMLIIGYKSSKWLRLSTKKSITISIESGIQNATVGITIGNMILSQGNGLSILSLPSGVYGILMYLVCLPFIFYMKNTIK